MLNKNYRLFKTCFGKYFGICIITILLLPAASYSQIEKQAQTGFRFLENPISAEVVGRGTVGIINTFNSNAIFWNPALLAFSSSDYDLSFNHTRGIAEINYNAVAASINLFDFGVLGFSLLAMDYGTFYSTVRLGESGYMDMGTFSPTAIAIGTAFSQKVTATS